MNTTDLSSLVRPKSIAVATDLNDLDFLLPVAMEQAKTAGATISLVHVIPPDAYASIETGAYPFVVREKEVRDAEGELAAIAQRVKQQGVSCDYEVRRWYPVDEIRDFVTERQVQRLILGTSGRGALGKFLIGSVAEELIRSLDIPVCTVGPHFRPCLQTNPRRILLAVSLRHHPEQSLRFALHLAALLPCELTVLHVAEPDDRDEGIDAGARAKLYELLKVAGGPKCSSGIRIRCGEPAEEILAECSALQPELLVLSAFAAPPLLTKFRTGVAYRVIAEAPCPVFTLRSGAKANRKADFREFATAGDVGAAG